MKQLNEKQLQAVKHIEGPLLVLAGAGSGKTKVVTSRIAYLIERGVHPDNILAVTFTNKAAIEMKKRVQSLTNYPILTSTFHSLGAKILRESLSHFGYTQNFTIYDEIDSKRLLKKCFKEKNIDEKDLKYVKQKISMAKNNLQFPKDILNNSNDFIDISKKKDQSFLSIYPIYQEKLKAYNALDFDDLLSLTVKILLEDENLLKAYQNRFKFLLIDEYQDTNHAQYSLAKILSNSHKNIFVVGDPDQSIYSWRGAKYQNILNFDKDFPNSKTISLEQNYRSTQNILSAANSVIEKNETRLEKNLWSKLGKGEKIKFFQAPDEQEEVNFVINSILKNHKNIPLEDIVIFYRTNSQSRKFEDILLRKNVPYIIYGGVSFYQRKEIKDILAYLKVANSNKDVISFLRTINLPKRGIGEATIKKLLKAAEDSNLPIISFCKKYLASPLLISLTQKQTQGLSNYISIIDKLSNLANENTKISTIISETLLLSNYLEYIKEDPETFQSRQENIEELLQKADDSTGSLSEFLEEITLLTNIKQKSEKSIKLMTLHSGKGLEFPLVFITGLEEDLFPHINAKDIEDIEEERRLFYVGMTRAKKYLYLTKADFRFIHGSAKMQRTSRFIKEINQTYLEDLSNFSEEIKSEFDEDEMVFHKTFGIGVIVKTYQTSYGKTYDIFFKNDKTKKTIIAKYANLTSV